MQLATRHSQIVDILRAHHQPVTAAYLAQETSVNVRTIYRDIACLMASNVPITGQAGIGYKLEAGYLLPPLMFNVEELEALLLGAGMVKRQGDTKLASAVDRAIEKISFVLPARLKDTATNLPLRVVPNSKLPTNLVELSDLRAALRKERKIKITYADEAGRITVRTVWPILLGYFEHVRMLVAWCEMRQGFRHFRSDRIQSFSLLPDDIPEKRKILEGRWQAETLALPKRTGPETTTL
jgi:predicted DNA-binding transcriptional regulator YafY